MMSSALNMLITIYFINQVAVCYQDRLVYVLPIFLPSSLIPLLACVKNLCMEDVEEMQIGFPLVLSVCEHVHQTVSITAMLLTSVVMVYLSTGPPNRCWVSRSCRSLAIVT